MRVGLVFVFTGLFACSASSFDETSSDEEAKSKNGAWQNHPACSICVTSADCTKNGVCAQFGGDTYCARPCTGTASCSKGYTCETVSAYDGQQASVCVPKNQVCGSNAQKGDGMGNTCGTFVSPSTPASCSCDPKIHSCDPNGCYGGWWCDTSNDTCHAPPQNCPQNNNNNNNQNNNNNNNQKGAIGPNGGSLATLDFAVIGDTRPPVINDTKAYPVAVISKIYQDLENAKIPFAVSTGDYLFSSANGGQSTPQLQMYLQARALYSGMWFPAMGNHECTGAVNSNCGPGSTTGSPKNYSDFVSMLLAPIQKTEPYYAIHVNANDSSWTAKFVFVAGNAWSSAQASWLDSALAQPTTYTFIIRHEPSQASAAPGVKPSEQIMAQHPYTLAIVGHTHTYGKTGARQVTIGNGGAPLTGGANYGWGHVTQRKDGSIQIDMIDYQSGQPDSSFRFALKPDGSPAP